MHGPIREHLEELLGTDAARPDSKVHLAACGECTRELSDMRQQAQMLRGLRAPEDIEPAPGFYARVMQRIEERKLVSMWSVLIDTPFGKHLAIASLALALVLGAWVIGVEKQDGHLGSGPVIAQQIVDVPVVGDQTQQRDAVLVNLAAYSEPVQ
jgi:hypothetical protein